MFRRTMQSGWLLPILLASLVSGPATGDPEGGENTLAKMKPKWRVGDRWIVETTTLPLQSRDEKVKPEAPKINWKYEVKGIEELAKRPCFRIDIACLAKGRAQPATTIWVEKESLAVRQLRTQLPIAGGFRTITESYEFPSGQVGPVISPLTALPIELPRFAKGATKAVEAFQFEAVSGPSGTKALGDMGFSFDVEQRVTSTTAAEVKALLHGDFAKNLEAPIVRVQLKTGDQLIKQLWRADLPWAAYTNNGTTIARLLQVLPAARDN